MDVLITEKSKDNLIGHNSAYEQVVLQKLDSNLMGKIVRVRVKETKKHCLIGEIINNPLESQRLLDNSRFIVSYLKPTIFLVFAAILFKILLTSL